MSPLIQNPDLGLNALVPPNALDLREAAEGSQNLVYEYGILRKPYGFAKIDLTSGLNSGDTILSTFQWKELDDTGHLTAVTTEKIYDHDRVNNEWDDKTQDSVTMASAIDTPISYAVVGHDDTAIYLDDDTSRAKAYHHVVVCDGGLSNIQRWAGKWETDFGDLVGGGGYHDGTQHRALQVSLSKRNRLLLLSPRLYSSSTATWVENNQMIQWPTIGKIETWTGTGSGFSLLLDTAGTNVWSASLGSDHIIYQTRGIWSLNWVGGTTVFSPVPVIPDLGLLSYHLLFSYNNVHYFVGTDFNVHAYYGGSVRKSIGDKIHKYLQEDLDPKYKNRCWLRMGPKGRFLYIFIVPSGSTYITKAYRRNMQTEAWMVMDYYNAWSSTTGISAICLAGAESYTIGETYQTALDTNSAYAVSDAGDITRRYADNLLEISRTLTKDYTAGTWGAGGLDYSKAAEAFTADISENDILACYDGSNATNTRYGTHFYTVFDVSTNGFAVRPTEDKTTNQEHGIADTSTNVPADLSIDGLDTVGFFSACDSGVVGDTYEQVSQNIQQQERLIFGDDAGYIYKIDETYTTNNGYNIDSRHLTPVIDGGLPGAYKRWPGIRVTAKGDNFNIRSRIGNFDTKEIGWTDISQELTNEWVNYEFPLNITSKKIQWSIRGHRTFEWIEISSSHYDSHCGDDGIHTIEGALGGTEFWGDELEHTHWFILNLGQRYDVKKIRSRSILPYAPIDVNIYVSNEKGIWGTAVKTGISTWHDTSSWVEIDVMEKNGQYVKVEIISTELALNYLAWGKSSPYMNIFDVYISSSDSETFQVSDFEIIPPTIEDNR